MYNSQSEHRRGKSVQQMATNHIDTAGQEAVRPKIDIQIDLDRIAEIAFLGLRRSMVFMGFGVNAADNDGLMEFAIPGPLTYQFVPENASPEQRKEMKKHFRSWIIAAALRDLLEAISIALDDFYLAVRITADKTIVPGGFDAVRAEVNRKSLSDKLKKLAELGMAPTYDSHFYGLTKVRNCLAHRLGRVADADCNDADKLTVTWRSFNVEIHTEAGHKHNLLDMIGRPLESPGHVVLVPVDRVKSFQKGSVIDLSHAELAEIGMMVNNAINHFRSETARLAAEHGHAVVKVVKPKAVQQAGQP